MNSEQSKSIPINIKQNVVKKITPEYGLKQNLFDPSKSSPPNEFMLKLRMRSSLYDSINRVVVQKC